ncbi:MAG: ABC transporter substrate-binding protein [Planctomycetota bacterium]
MRALHVTKRQKPVLCVLFCLLAFLGCSSDSKPSTGDPSSTQVAVQLNWYPESEHGGLYQALSDGTYAADQLDVVLRPGGRATQIATELALGRCEFAIANADDVIIANQEGLDIVAVMAAMQDHPRCIMVRDDSGVAGFEDLRGKTFQRGDRAYVEFLRSRGFLEGVKEVPYHGSIASLVADPEIVIQAYCCAEPLLAKQQGVAVKTLMVSELGFNPYSSVLVTSKKVLEERPEMVRQFVKATRVGWRNYLADGKSGNAAILEANDHGMTAEALQFGSEAMRELAMPEGVTAESVGMMSDERWQSLFDQMAELDLVDPEEVNAADCYTLDFLD